MKNSSRDIDLEKQIDAYVKGHLTDEEADRLWVKLLKNPAYIDLLDTELYIKSIVEQQNRQTGEVTYSRIGFWNKSWKWVAAAASIGILIVALSLLRGSEEENRPGALPVISMAEHLASPDIVRAGEAELSDADSVLNNGFKAAISGQLGNALQTYQEVISSYPDDIHAVAGAYFNIGIIRYNTGRFAEAAGAFNRAVEQADENRILEEKAHWFLANAYIHINEFKSAREAVKHVYSLDGIYRDQASRLLERLSQISVEKN